MKQAVSALSASVALFTTTNVVRLSQAVDLDPPVAFETTAKHKLRHAIFDDDIWTAAMNAVHGDGPTRRSGQTPSKGGGSDDSTDGSMEKQGGFPPEDSADIPPKESNSDDHPGSGGRIEIPPQPLMPEKFTFTGIITRSLESDSIYDNQPLVYTFAVDGNEGSITGDDMTLYFQLDDFACEGNETESRSFMVGDFQFFDGVSDEPVPTEFCWTAPPGFVIYEGYPPKYKSMIQTWLIADLFGIQWQYGGTTMSLLGPVHLWIRETISEAVDYSATAASTVLATLVEDGSVIYYQTRVDLGSASGTTDFFDAAINDATATIKIDVLLFETFGDDEDVPNAAVPYAAEDCQVMQPGYNTAPCFAGNASAGNAFISFVTSLTAKGTGYDPDAPSQYESTQIPYDMVGDQDLVMSLDFFVPPLNNRTYTPVRDQGSCGSCYSFAAAEVISSTFNQAYPGNTFVFSNQHIMDCLPLSEARVAEEGILFAQDSGVGCWGGTQSQVIDWLVQGADSKMPLITEVPYQGFSGTCNYSVPAYDTGIIGWSNLTSVEEIKNALYYRGDVSISLLAGDDWSPDNFGGQVSFPFFLGVGLSGVPPGGANHAITVIGWGPCLVPLGDEIDPCGGPLSPLVIGECWIVQNSWGPTWGYNGYLFINNDPLCDTGVSHNNPLIPRRHDDVPPGFEGAYSGSADP